MDRRMEAGKEKRKREGKNKNKCAERSYRLIQWTKVTTI